MDVSENYFQSLLVFNCEFWVNIIQMLKHINITIYFNKILKRLTMKWRLNEIKFMRIQYKIKR